MSVKSIIVCDFEGCEQVKKDANHWYSVWMSQGDFLTRAGTDTEGPHIKHVCGREHAQALYERFLATGSLEKPQPQELSEPGDVDDFLPEPPCRNDNSVLTVKSR